MFPLTIKTFSGESFRIFWCRRYRDIGDQSIPLFVMREMVNLNASFGFIFYLSVRRVRTRSCCSNFNFSLDCFCWFCVSTSLLLLSPLVEIHLLLTLVVCRLARSICLANWCRIDMVTVTFDNLQNIFALRFTISRDLVKIL